MINTTYNNILSVGKELISIGGLDFSALSAEKRADFRYKHYCVVSEATKAEEAYYKLLEQIRGENGNVSDEKLTEKGIEEVKALLGTSIEINAQPIVFEKEFFSANDLKTEDVIKLQRAGLLTVSAPTVECEENATVE
jgi:hypothetical protein